MPFDGKEQVHTERLEMIGLIDRVIEQLPSEDRWCKGALYTVDGRRCILGAMQAANGALVLKAPILQAIREVTGRRYTAIETFNDRRSTTFLDVRLVLAQARKNICLNGAPAIAQPKASWLRRLIFAS